jgi:S1-C subfamily serine protease
MYRIALLLALLLTTTALAERPYTGIVRTDTVAPVTKTITAPCEIYGSFVIVSPSHVLTNWHNVKDLLYQNQLGNDGSLTLRFSDGSTQPAEVVKIDSTNDLALLKFSGGLRKGLHRIGIAKEFNPETLSLTGYQGGQVDQYAEETASSYSRVSNAWFTFPVVAIPGQSGSPIIDQDGKLCGLLWGSDYPEATLAYGISVNVIREFLPQEILSQKGN